MSSIQEDTERLAGQGGWLEHLEWDVNARCATWQANSIALLNRRAAAGQSSNACRCGRDIPAPGAAVAMTVPTPVAMCTACSGVLVDINSNVVVNWQQNPVYPANYNAVLTLENHLTLGRDL
ncbi:hypothetical protein LTR36_010124 [Oleoguttula mirabilis]|uniref:Uncharacterized protein n=1 Tax=Oleoguttula mirabilis TaxID=1507867 RepID=A0AAV9JS08_9PEZI|nr:hypothetical protein LTR36_010124 [Oleoguttula mirabilis]